MNGIATTNVRLVSLTCYIETIYGCMQLEDTQANSGDGLTFDRRDLTRFAADTSFPTPAAECRDSLSLTHTHELFHMTPLANALCVQVTCHQLPGAHGAKMVAEW